jgi:hypothetical protein
MLQSKHREPDDFEMLSITVALIEPISGGFVHLKYSYEALLVHALRPYIIRGI